MKYVHRTLERVVAHANTRFKAIFVNGAKQVGKRTMLHALGEGRQHVSLDDFDTFRFASDSPEEFFKKFPPPVFINEIQGAPSLLSQIETLENNFDKRAGVWASSSFCHEKLRRLLDFRRTQIGEYKLLPFSLYERQQKPFEQKPYLPNGLSRGSLRKQNTDQTLKLIWQGSWPEVINATFEGRNIFYKRLLESFTEKEVIFAGVRKLETFKRFIVALSSGIGQEIRLNALSSEVGISMATAKEWLSLAEAVGIIYLLPAFPENIGRAVIKKPKLYFTDTGFASWLCKVPSPKELNLVFKVENMFRNFVIIEILKSWCHNGRRPEFYYFRDTRFNEVDLLIRSEGKYYPIEIKMTASPKPGTVKTFKLIKGGNFELGQVALICMCETPSFITEEVVAHSIWDI